MRSSRVRMATIWRAYSLGHVTVVCRDGWQFQSQLLSQPGHPGLPDLGRLAVDGTMEAVLAANQGLADEAQPYRAGVVIFLPDMPAPTQELVMLWD